MVDFTELSELMARTFGSISEFDDSSLVGELKEINIQLDRIATILESR